MARKNLLNSVLGAPDSEKKSSDIRNSYAMRGASGKMKASLDTIAENSRKMLEGETIVEVDTDIIDGSFIKDRLSGAEQEFFDLKETIELQGQDTPVLLRPHPHDANRYMIVFGHRRVQVARELALPVRAIIKEIDDRQHVIAQGQENSARSNLSFIEKAMFAKRLLDEGYDRDVIQSALTVDATLLSRLLSVSQKIDIDVIEAIGPAKSVGRDRWESLKKLIILPANRKRALTRITELDFEKLSSDGRFEELLLLVQSSKTASKAKIKPASKEQWSSKNGRVKSAFGRAGQSFSLSFKADDGADFGAYITDNLDSLYEAFSKSQQEKQK